jgi:hypothetical protein
MKKVNLISLIVGLFLISFVSAADFSLGDMFDNIDSSTMILGVAFIISFALIYFALSNFFKDKATGEPNKPIATVVALAISLLITYGINKMDLDLQEFVFNIGIQEDLLMIILPLIVLAGIIFLFVKFKSGALLIIGGFLILIAFFVEEKMFTAIIGIILVIIGFVLLLKKRGLGPRYSDDYQDYPDQDYPPRRGPDPRKVFKQNLKNIRRQAKVGEAPKKARGAYLYKGMKKEAKRRQKRAKRQENIDRKKTQQQQRQVQIKQKQIRQEIKRLPPPKQKQITDERRMRRVN